MNSAKQSWISSRSFHGKSISSPHLTFFNGGIHGFIFKMVTVPESMCSVWGRDRLLLTVTGAQTNNGTVDFLSVFRLFTEKLNNQVTQLDALLGICCYIPRSTCGSPFY